MDGWINPGRESRPPTSTSSSRYQVSHCGWRGSAKVNQASERARRKTHPGFRAFSVWHANFNGQTRKSFSSFDPPLLALPSRQAMASCRPPCSKVLLEGPEGNHPRWVWACAGGLGCRIGGAPPRICTMPRARGGGVEGWRGGRVSGEQREEKGGRGLSAGMFGPGSPCTSRRSQPQPGGKEMSSFISSSTRPAAVDLIGQVRLRPGPSCKWVGFACLPDVSVPLNRALLLLSFRSPSQER